MKVFARVIVVVVFCSKEEELNFAVIQGILPTLLLAIVFILAIAAMVPVHVLDVLNIQHHCVLKLRGTHRSGRRGRGDREVDCVRVCEKRHQSE